MKKLVFFILTLAVSLGTSCTRIDCSEPSVHKNYTSMKGFNALRASHAFEVNLIPSDHESVELVIPPDAQNYVVVQQKGGTLYIGMKNGYNYKFVHLWGDCGLKAIVHFKEMRQIRASGASEVDIEGAYDARNQNMEISLSGASSFEGEVLNVGYLNLSLSGASSLEGAALNVNRLVADLSGASEMELKGSGNDADIELSGASEAKMYGFPVKNFEGSLSGASDAYLTVTETFSATASGASTIRVKGRPRVLKANTSGASNIVFE
ncbi:MAG: DUF2807 domain-containing protein [Bacteroidales bacterium]|nr:DUF2807 domain-containing protein [Bacteroidales bacterium]